jgi:tripartite-type tricarboxylate transporter receptor subunit TctC
MPTFGADTDGSQLILGRNAMSAKRKWFRAAAGGVLAVAFATPPALAQTGADFYKGKTVTYIVSTAPGGGYDLYGRLISEYMQKYLPGSTFIVKNMPGAGHLIGANAIYASQPDGLTIGTFNTGLIYNQLIQAEGVKFDLTKMSWIGKAASEPRVFVIAQQAPIKTFADLRSQKQPVNFATSGIGSANYVEINSLTNILKLPVKILTGYNGNDDQLAMRRGEVQGGMGSRSSFEQFVKNGYGHYVAQIGGKDKDVPQLKTLVTDPIAQEIIALIQSQGDIARLTAGPPGIPKDRLDALRTAYKKALEDKELQAKAEKLERPVDPAYGDDVLNMVKAALNQRPESIALLKQALEQKETAPPATKGTISDLQDGNRTVVLKLADGKTFEAKVSGSRTEITVGGQKSDRNAMKTGMTCSIEAPKSGAEAKTIACN